MPPPTVISVRGVHIKVGDPLWLVFYAYQTDSYVPRCMGTVRAVKGTQADVDGKWYECGAHPPAFTSKDAAERWIAEHPFQAPTIK